MSAGMQRIVIESNSDLAEKVEKYTNDTAFKAQYPIHAWNVTRVTDMSHLFENQTTFNENICQVQTGQTH